ncbi:MAG: MOSC domain-containing protein [Novosphingobium sp.]|nr:MOSC domain-containing protein [Novosphingobium sp.]
MKLTLGPVMVGTPVPFRGEEASAIAKRPVAGPVAVGPLGLAGDEQADKVHHGGVDMAVHHYPHDHYPAWRAELDDHPLLAAAGAFGENISTDGLTEEIVLIGDRFRLGSALVEVSQGRQPCWKIDHKFERKGITARVLQTVRCGWYYRVLEPGTVSEGDYLELVERGHEGWDVERVFRAMFHKGASTQELVGVAQLTALSQEWRGRALELAVLQEGRAHR